MKKITALLIIVFILLTACACSEKAPQNEEYVPPVTELDNVTMNYGIVDGHFPATSKELTEWAKYIAVVKPLHTYLESDYDGVLYRECTVEKVLKGELSENDTVTICEFADLTENGVILCGGSPLMAKGFEYIVFFNDDNHGGRWYDMLHGGAYCLNTDVNAKIQMNQTKYAGVMNDYREYFFGNDFRITENTEKEFSTKHFCWNGFGSKLTTEFENTKYNSFADLYYPQEHFFKDDIKFRYAGKNTDGQRIYRSDNDGFNGRMIYVLDGGYLTPYLKDGNTFENSEIVGMRIYEKSNNDFCYEVPFKDVQKLVSKLKNGVFTPETTNDFFEDDAVLLDFYDAEGIHYHSVLYIEKGKLFGNTIGKDLTDTILSFMTEQNKVENLHIDDTYK